MKQFIPKLAAESRSDHNGGRFRCGETAGTPPVTYPACTDSASYGPDSGETRPYQFNDVDDYQTSAICAATKEPPSCDGDWVPANYFSTHSGQKSGESEYLNFWIRIRVTADDLGQAPPPCTHGIPCVGKRLELTVRLPDGGEVDFALYRGNY